jgi:proline iminopeptidase
MGVVKSTFLLFLIPLLFNCQNNNDTQVTLWPEIEPYESGYLKVSDIHEIYYELCGNPEGKPVFVIHGGPGRGCSPYDRRFFNPDKFNIVLHDQRGAGVSKPTAELKENTTQYLVEDIETLRKKLNLGKIILFGGSWGSTLSLAYAEAYPENVDGIVLRAVYLPSKDDKDFWEYVVPKFFPYEYEALVEVYPDSLLPPTGMNLFELLNTNDKLLQMNIAKAAERLEWKACFLFQDDEELDEYYGNIENEEEILRNMLIEHFYISNLCFLEEGQLLRDAHKIKNIQTIIINGRYDILCPPVYAYQLHKLLPKSKLIIAEKAGHVSTEKPIQKELLVAMREFEE